MKILMAVSVPFPEGRGNTRRIRTIAAALAKQGHLVTILLPFARQSTPSTINMNGYTVTWCEVPIDENIIFNTEKRVKTTVQIRSRLKWCYKIYTMSKNNEYEWIYFYQTGLDGLIAACIARIFKKYIVSEYVDILSNAEYKTVFLKVVYMSMWLSDIIVPKLSHLILVISHVLERKYTTIASKKCIRILPTLVNADLFQSGNPLRYRVELGLLNSPIIVYTGSFAKPQGVKNLIMSVKQIAIRHPDVKLLLAGGAVGIDRDDVSSLIVEYDLTNTVIYLGQLDQNDIIDLQSAADILVMPKLNDHINEAGMSTKLAEYLASGKPVVASCIGDVALYLKSNEHILFCVPGNIDDLTDNLTRLLTDKRLSAEIGLAGKQVAEKYFSVDNHIREMCESMKTIANNKC